MKLYLLTIRMEANMGGINNQGSGKDKGMNKTGKDQHNPAQQPNRQPGQGGQQQGGYGQPQKPQGGHQQPGSFDKSKDWNKKGKDDQR